MLCAVASLAAESVELIDARLTVRGAVLLMTHAHRAAIVDPVNHRAIDGHRVLGDAKTDWVRSIRTRRVAYSSWIVSRPFIDRPRNGCGCVPDQAVNFVDISGTVDAFRNLYAGASLCPGACW